MSAAGKRLDISWTARASWRLRRHNFQGCIHHRHIRHYAILQFHRRDTTFFRKYLLVAPLCKLLQHSDLFKKAITFRVIPSTLSYLKVSGMPLSKKTWKKY
ncbi:uncharacterized protein LOC143153522 [Ptiloglossa arizonensis]|uniref:uncharacterized protein LOC143153522 n=1 Tax=Ptiloglossa arizonensis TaxID=3350558 RepID=UPI003F9ED5C5